ncbi:pyruvate kinase [Gracilaria domingensis]|nr:pyruvate kinase [Gracilaria domingensis]
MNEQLTSSSFIRSDANNRADGTILTHQSSGSASFCEAKNDGGIEVIGSLDGGCSDGFRDGHVLSAVVTPERLEHITIIEHFLSFAANADHSTHGLRRVEPLCSFAGKHDAIRSVKHSIGDVGGFRPGRSRAFLVLDLGHDLDGGAAVGAQKVANADDVRGLSDEGGGDHVDLLLASKLEIGLVLVGEGRQVDLGARQIDAFGLAQHAVIVDAAGDLVRGGVGAHDGERDEAVVDEDLGALVDGGGHAVVRVADRVRVADVRKVGQQHDGFAGAEVDFVAALELAGADLGPLGVQHDAAHAAGGGEVGAQVGDGGGVVFVVAVREVEAHDVHAGVDERAEALLIDIAADGADDLAADAALLGAEGALGLVRDLEVVFQAGHAVAGFLLAKEEGG